MNPFRWFRSPRTVTLLFDGKRYVVEPGQRFTVTIHYSVLPTNNGQGLRSDGGQIDMMVDVDVLSVT